MTTLDTPADATTPPPPTASGSRRGAPTVRLRRDGRGDPIVSATFVLERRPRPDERLAPLVRSANLALDLELVGDDLSTLLVDSARFTLERRRDGVRVAEQSTTGSFAAAALQATIEDTDAGALLAGLVTVGGDAAGHTVHVHAVRPATPAPATEVSISLAALWRHLDAVADDTRIFHETDLLNYLPGLVDSGAIVVDAGDPGGRAVLAAVRRGAPTVLRRLDSASSTPIGDALDDLGPAYRLAAGEPPDMQVTSTSPTDAAGADTTVTTHIALAELVAPAIAHDPDRFVHLVALDGGRLDDVLPARRATRSGPTDGAVARSTVASRIRITDGVQASSLHAALEPRPAGLSATIAPNLLAHHTSVLVAADLGFSLTPGPLPGPVVDDPDAPIWRDRADRERIWYLPEFRLVTPDPAAAVDETTPFRFDVEPDGGHDLAGNRGISATITVTLEARRSDATAAALRAAGADAASPIDVTALDAHLAIPFRDEDGTTRTEQLAAASITPPDGGLVDGARVEVRFVVLDNWARLAYGALSTPGFQTRAPEVTLTFGFEGWRRITTRPTLAGPGKRWALLAERDTGAADPRRAATVTRPAAATLSNVAHVLTANHALVRPAWTIRPDLVADLGRVSYERSEFAAKRTVEATMPCATFGTAYRERADDGGWHVVGCRPALQLGQVEYRTYEPVEVTAAAGHAAVYRSLRSPGRFLVVPVRSTIGRHEPGGERAYEPSVLLHSTIDVDDPTNIRCVLAASLQPDLPPWVRAAIRAELTTTAHPAPVLEYLADCGVAADVSWAAPSQVDIETVQTASGFEVVMSTDPAGFLVLRSLLERGGVHGVASVDLPGGVRISTELVVALDAVCGPFTAGPVSVVPTRGGTFRLTNRIAQRVAVRALADDGAEVARVDTALAAGDELEVPAPDGVVTPQVVYDVDDGAEVLTEVRAYIEDLELSVLFVLTGDLAASGLAGLEIDPRVDDQSPGVVTLTAERREAEQHFTLPLTEFVDDPVLTFRVTAVATDGTRTSGDRLTWSLQRDGALIPVGPPGG